MIGYAFSSCLSLKEITIPKNVATLTTCVFNDCGLEEVNLTDGLQKIDFKAFCGCPFTSISVPNTVTNISSTAFGNCTKLSEINLNQNQNFVYENGMLMPSNKESVLFISSAQLSKTDTLTIPDGVKEFTTNIYKMYNITTIKIPASLEKIGDASNFTPLISNVTVDNGNQTFSSENGILYNKNTKGLIMCYSKDSDITIQEGILSLGEKSFSQAYKAVNITLPDSLRTIGRHAFTNCTKIQSLKIGKGVSSISPYFKYTNFSGTISIDSANPNFMVKDNILYSKDGKTMYNVLYQIQGTFTVPASVEKISGSFAGQEKMTELKISEGVKEIGNYTIEGSKITKIEIPSSMQIMEKRALVDCSSLTQVIIHKPKDSIAGAPWEATKGMKVVQWDE